MVITLLSDFGDVYPASMKGVILGINPVTAIVDISHSVPRHNIRSGAFVLLSTVKYFPSGTVHIAVVDPGVGTARRALAIEAESSDAVHYFIGPDNGILIPAARSMGNFEAYEITNRNLFRKFHGISSTFHGRDIFAPVGAWISKGVSINKVGKRVFDFVELDFEEGEKVENGMQGTIIFVDSFGNIVTNIPSDKVDFQTGDVLELEGKRIVFQSSYGFCKKGEPVALVGSHGFLEVAVNQGNASIFFNKKEDDEIILKKSHPNP